jgi:uncharacterized sulfatase
MRACLAVLCAVLAVAPLHAAEKPGPNLIAVVTDDQAQWALGCYGNKECRTPNMDRLAREGARFRNAFVTTPVCSPSRAGYMSGRYGTQLGITDWISPAEGEANVGLSPDVPTWPKVLQKAGYRTALIGKWHLGDRPQYHPTRNGFDHFFGFLGGGSTPMNPTLERDGKNVKIDGSLPDILTDDAIRFVTDNKERPFALLLHFREPHLPYAPVPEQDSKPFADLDPTIPKFPGLDAAQTKRWTKEYYGSVHAADRNLGRLLAKLDELGLAKTTVVLFTSDHGYNIGHHGLHTKGNGYWIAGGVRGPTRPNMFDTSLRVPLLLRGPGIKAGTEIDEMVVQIDTFASLPALLGVPLPPGTKHEGRDFSPLLRGERVVWRDAIFGQYDLHNGGLAYMRMIRTTRWKLVRYHYASGLDEMYDLEADPDEAQNLYGQAKHRAVRDELQERLTAWQKSIDDPVLRGR